MAPVFSTRFSDNASQMVDMVFNVGFMIYFLIRVSYNFYTDYTIFVCLYVKVSLTAGLTWFSFTIKLLIFSEGFFNYLVEGNAILPRDNVFK